MLELTITADEIWDEATQTFIYPKEQNLRLEHSLVSLSKWESKYCKPFMTDKELTIEETLDYIRFMTINKNSVESDVYKRITNEHIKQVLNYINAPMTATTFPKKEGKGTIRGEQVTSELIYYWMVSLNIPFEPCQKWHLNRLITLIKVCDFKNQPPKKMSQQELLKRNAKLNAQRRAKYSK